MRELRELIQFTLLLYIGRKDRELKQIEIAEKKLALLKKLRELPDFPPGRAEDYEALLGVRDSQLPNIDPIIRGVIEGRIVGCKNVESDAGKE